MNSNKLGIFVFYDKDGIMDEYIEVLLDAFSKLMQDLIVIVNGKVTEDSYEKLQKHAKKIYVRDNVGYDAGAYKDYFTQYTTIDEWGKYDEILMMNDTFYGPIYPLEELMNMIDCSEADFGGITMHPASDKEIKEHIQSYFLFIKRTVFCDKCFGEFWDKLLYPLNHEDAVANFEIAFTTYFKEKGYTYEAYDGSKMEEPCWKDRKNTYLYHPYELIVEKRIPFLKKGCFSFSSPCYGQTLRALRYLETYFDFDSDMIWKNICRLSKRNLFKNTINYFELEKFYNTHSKVYIYGAGQVACALQKYFEYRNWQFKCFVVSDSQKKEGQNVKYLSEIILRKEEGIIIAVGHKYCHEICNEIKDILEDGQVLYP